MAFIGRDPHPEGAPVDPRPAIAETCGGSWTTKRHDGRMELDALIDAVEAAFVRTSAGLEHWDDPHPPPDRVVAEEQYSRVTNPSRWRIVGARTDAWIDALVELGLATLERDADPRWAESPPAAVTRIDVVTPRVVGGLPLVLCRSRIEDVMDAGVTLGAGDPAVPVAFLPDCGCDACDSGSQDVIDLLDSCLRPVVSGEFRYLRRGRQSIMVLEDGSREGHNVGMSDSVDPRAAGRLRFLPTSRRPVTRLGEDRRRDSNVAPRPGRRTRDRMTQILADPAGWDEVSGPSWLPRPHRDMRH